MPALLGILLLLLAPTAAIIGLSHAGMVCASRGGDFGGQSFESGYCLVADVAPVWLAGATPAVIGLILVLVGIRRRAFPEAPVPSG